MTNNRDLSPGVEQGPWLHGEAFECGTRKMVWRVGQLGGIMAVQRAKLLLQRLAATNNRREELPCPNSAVRSYYKHSQACYQLALETPKATMHGCLQAQTGAEVN